LGTMRTIANRWTSQRRCNRRCCLIRKIYDMDKGGMRFRCYISSIYLILARVWLFFLSLCCALLSLHACIVICVLLLPFCRSNAVIHVIQLVYSNDIVILCQNNSGDDGTLAR
jgi:hypothetical protein